MNNNMKLVVLLLIVFVATGSIVYQIRSRRPRAPVIAQAPRSSSSLPAPAASPALPADGAVTSSATPTPAEAPTNVPASGWGRNPFMTRDEINQLNRAQVQEVIQVPAPPTTVQPAAPAGPPTYNVTAIIYGPNGSFAVINSRVVQPGDRVGYETVKEIKSRAVVLEYEGRTRELPLRRTGPEIQLAVPKGD